jgi:uncharacterized membrane protein
MHYWFKFFDFNEFNSRIPSIIFSLVSLYFLYRTLSDLTEKKLVQYAGLFLLTVSSLNIEFSQEARPYTMFLALYSYVIWKIINTIRYKRLTKMNIFLLALANVFGIYIHYDYLLYMSSLFLSLLIFSLLKRGTKVWALVKKIMISFGITALFFIPWIPIFVSNMGSEGAYGDLVNKVGVGFFHFISGINYFYFINANLIIEVISYIIFTLFIVLAVINVLNSNYISNSVLFLIIVFLITSVVYVLSPLSHIYSYTWQRHTIPISYVWMILQTLFSLIYVRKKYVGIIFFIMFILLNLGSINKVLMNDSKWFYNHQHKNIYTYVKNNEVPGDLIVIPRPTFNVLAAYYYDGENRVTSIINDDFNENNLPLISTIKIASSNNEKFREEKYIEGLEEISSKYDRIWVVNYLTKESSFLKRYFSNKDKWEIHKVEEIPYQRLWLIKRVI